jgi:hypothetical protein
MGREIGKPQKEAPTVMGASFLLTVRARTSSTSDTERLVADVLQEPARGNLHAHALGAG